MASLILSPKLSLLTALTEASKEQIKSQDSEKGFCFPPKEALLLRNYLLDTALDPESDAPAHLEAEIIPEGTQDVFPWVYENGETGIYILDSALSSNPKFNLEAVKRVYAESFATSVLASVSETLGCSEEQVQVLQQLEGHNTTLQARGMGDWFRNHMPMPMGNPIQGFFDKAKDPKLPTSMLGRKMGETYKKEMSKMPAEFRAMERMMMTRVQDLASGKKQMTWLLEFLMLRQEELAKDKLKELQGKDHHKRSLAGAITAHHFDTDVDNDNNNSDHNLFQRDYTFRGHLPSANASKAQECHCTFPDGQQAPQVLTGALPGSLHRPYACQCTFDMDGQKYGFYVSKGADDGLPASAPILARDVLDVQQPLLGAAGSPVLNSNLLIACVAMLALLLVLLASVSGVVVFRRRARSAEAAKAADVQGQEAA